MKGSITLPVESQGLNQIYMCTQLHVELTIHHDLLSACFLRSQSGGIKVASLDPRILAAVEVAKPFGLGLSSEMKLGKRAK